MLAGVQPPLPPESVQNIVPMPRQVPDEQARHAARQASASSEGPPPVAGQPCSPMRARPIAASRDRPGARLFC